MNTPKHALILILIFHVHVHLMPMSVFRAPSANAMKGVGKEELEHLIEKKQSGGGKISPLVVYTNPKPRWWRTSDIHSDELLTEKPTFWGEIRDRIAKKKAHEREDEDKETDGIIMRVIYRGNQSTKPISLRKRLSERSGKGIGEKGGATTINTEPNAVEHLHALWKAKMAREEEATMNVMPFQAGVSFLPGYEGTQRTNEDFLSEISCLDDNEHQLLKKPNAPILRNRAHFPGDLQVPADHLKSHEAYCKNLSLYTDLLSEQGKIASADLKYSGYTTRWEHRELLKDVEEKRKIRENLEEWEDAIQAVRSLLIDMQRKKELEEEIENYNAAKRCVQKATRLENDVQASKEKLACDLARLADLEVGRTVFPRFLNARYYEVQKRILDEKQTLEKRGKEWQKARDVSLSFEENLWPLWQKVNLLNLRIGDKQAFLATFLNRLQASYKKISEDRAWMDNECEKLQVNERHTKYLLECAQNEYLYWTIQLDEEINRPRSWISPTQPIPGKFPKERREVLAEEFRTRHEELQTFPRKIAGYIEKANLLRARENESEKLLKTLQALIKGNDVPKEHKKTLLRGAFQEMTTLWKTLIDMEPQCIKPGSKKKVSFKPEALTVSIDQKHPPYVSKIDHIKDVCKRLVTKIALSAKEIARNAILWGLKKFTSVKEDEPNFKNLD